MLKVTAGIRWLPHLRKSWLLSGGGPGGSGPAVAFLFWFLLTWIISCGFLCSTKPSHRFIMNAGNDFLIHVTLKGAVVFIAFATKTRACGLIYVWVNPARFTSLFYYIFLLYLPVCCWNLPLPHHDDSSYNSWAYVSAGGLDNWLFSLRFY